MLRGRSRNVDRASERAIVDRRSVADWCRPAACTASAIPARRRCTSTRCWRLPVFEADAGRRDGSDKALGGGGLGKRSSGLSPSS